MDNPIADALLKIAEVHDRRLGELSKSLEKLAEAFTHYDMRDLNMPVTGMDHLAQQISDLDATLGDAVEKLIDRQQGHSD